MGVDIQAQVLAFWVGRAGIDRRYYVEFESLLEAERKEMIRLTILETKSLYRILPASPS